MSYGLNADSSRWIAEPNRSDIKIITGSHAAVIGWDLGKLELDDSINIDGVNFEFMRKKAVKHHLEGGFNTFSWHPNNPLNLKKSSWDNEYQTISRVLNNKDTLKMYLKTLDKVADFFLSLKTFDGKLVPVMFRPYHEHTGSWFWWGEKHTLQSDYIKFWKITYKYLTKKRRVNNLLWVYSTDSFRDEQHYLERYPGDKYVDILGFDYYHRNSPKSDSFFVQNAKKMVSTVKKLGVEKDKLYAFTETGIEKVPHAFWWTAILYPILKDSGLSYFLVWRNGRPDHYYAPFQNQVSSQDFLKFTEKKDILLLNEY